MFMVQIGSGLIATHETERAERLRLQPPAY